MGSSDKSKAPERDEIKDLAPKETRQVKGGRRTLGDIVVVKEVDKGSP